MGFHLRSVPFSSMNNISLSLYHSLNFSFLYFIYFYIVSTKIKKNVMRTTEIITTKNIISTYMKYHKLKMQQILLWKISKLVKLKKNVL